MSKTEKTFYKKFHKTISKVIAKYPQEVRLWLDEVYLLEVE